MFMGELAAGYVDCGTCLCVAQETCILCPGAWTNPTDEGQIVSKPSSVPYCPASYVAGRSSDLRDLRDEEIPRGQDPKWVTHFDHF
jgi:hypothetical protein